MIRIQQYFYRGVISPNVPFTVKLLGEHGALMYHLLYMTKRYLEDTQYILYIGVVDFDDEQGTTY